MCSYFLQAYERGHTPNPDVLCNRHIKFRALHHYCRQHLEVDAIATGHYARVEKDRARTGSELCALFILTGLYVLFHLLFHTYTDVSLLLHAEVRLKMAVDWCKDQTYFLSQVSQVNIVHYPFLNYKNIIFPFFIVMCMQVFY